MTDATNLRQSLGVNPKGPNGGPFHKTLASAANLGNLLPTGTTLAFQALTPSFTHCGACYTVHKYLTACLVALFALICFLSSFTDNFKGADGKLYYGIATPKGLYVFNIGRISPKEVHEREGDLTKYRITFIDFVHALVSLLVFLVFALGDPHVLRRNFMLRQMRNNGRLEIVRVLINRPEILCTSRQNGRLRLHLVFDDECEYDDAEEETGEEVENEEEEEAEERENEVEETTEAEVEVDAAAEEDREWNIPAVRRCYQREVSQAWGQQQHRYVTTM
ncbi:hypothetical protein Cgig2_003455 [Carnegiea gigantea]|uniref:FAF domain-containing protein n=1 Tax=Carnegiea gigantea TaxID=171969 RepID=A0A9Q1QH10_9CARY|nr:hypothetical protein Cgig2_003455 [Carnegiea gigantea]